MSFLNDKELTEIIIDDNRLIFTDHELDVSFIEIKEKDKVNNKIQFLEIYNNNLNNDEEIFNIKSSVYILNYLYGRSIVASFGVIEKIKNTDIYYSCNTSYGSSGSPILCLKTNKVIGIHSGHNKVFSKYNQGTLLSCAIERLITQLNSSHKKNLEIDTGIVHNNDNNSREKTYNTNEEDIKYNTSSYFYYNKNLIKGQIKYKQIKDNINYKYISIKTPEKRRVSTIDIRKRNKSIDFGNVTNYEEKTKTNKIYEKPLNKNSNSLKKTLNRIEEMSSDDELNTNNNKFFESNQNNKKYNKKIRNNKYMKKNNILEPGCFPRYFGENCPDYKNIEIKSVYYQNTKKLNTSNSKRPYV